MRFFRALHAILRHIFDESAYERFCACEGLATNRHSYARFLRASEEFISRNVKCC